MLTYINAVLKAQAKVCKQAAKALSSDIRSAHTRRGAALGMLADAVKRHPVLSVLSTQLSRRELVKTLVSVEPTDKIEARAGAYLASAKKEEDDEREGHTAGPSIGGSTRAGGAPDNGETAAFMQHLAGNGANDDDSAEGSRTPHDLSREESQNEDDTSMQDLADDPDGDFDTHAADKNLERIIAELGIARI
ncbi:hypothetical protein KC318_g8400 [Hortaea werneckii]|nr:hypothetical protein KC334_g8559 [Hortaea werneckii]KAI7004974.1 hypothetical protein KC355_g8443 [Hortaea werneckii]KAI7663282.1 hypothetical protein KC318_g8400 [Hortaea werneckii]